jgi:intracellular multiplication protein IcmG
VAKASAPAASAPVKKASAAPKKSSKPKVQTSHWDEPYSPPAQMQEVSLRQGQGSGGWELRGATSGRAIIARGSDIREVGVGETVSGLGEITGVASVNGRWVVQGTQGRLSQ